MEERLVIVDGYNLILRAPALRPGSDRTLAASREKLENLLGWVMGSQVHFLVIYDGAQGTGRGGRRGRVEVRFSHPPQKADDLIRALVEERIEKGERVTVVTADLEVARHARSMGADIALADLFLASALGPSAADEAPEKPATVTKQELVEWADLFRRRASEPEEEDDEPGR